MKSYTIQKTCGTPNWEKIPAMVMEYLPWSDPVDIKAQTQICWDAEALYIRQEAKEAFIRAEETGPLCMPCLDSCMEFFFRPTERAPYINVEINPNKAIYLGYGPVPRCLTRLLPPKVEELFDIQTDPNELNNLIDSPEYEKVKSRLSKTLVRFRKRLKVNEF